MMALFLQMSSAMEEQLTSRCFTWQERERRSRLGSRHFSPYAHRGDIYLTFSSNIHFSCWTSARRWNSSPTSSSDSSAGRWDWGLPAPDWRTEDVIREQHVIVRSYDTCYVIANCHCRCAFYNRISKRGCHQSPLMLTLFWMVGCASFIMSLYEKEETEEESPVCWVLLGLLISDRTSSSRPKRQIRIAFVIICSAPPLQSAKSVCLRAPFPLSSVPPRQRLSL